MICRAVSCEEQKGRSVSHRKKKKPFSGRSAEELVHLFAQAETGDEAAYHLFSSEIAARLRARALTDTFAEEVFHLLPEEAMHPFVWACERLAAQEEVRIGEAPGYLQLFIIPLHGEIHAMEDAFRDGSLLTEVARFLRPTGYATERSSVLLKPDLFPVTALSLLNPIRIRDLLMDAAAPLTDQNGSGAVRRLLREAEGISVNAEEAFGPKFDATVLGVRFLIGARVSELEGLPDGLLADPEEDEGAAEIREDAWDDRTYALLGEDPGFMIDPPVSWGEARTELLTCAVRQAAELALLAEGVEVLFSACKDLTSRTALHGEELEIQILYRGRRLTEIRLHFDLIGPDMTDLLDLIELEYPPERSDADLTPQTLH
jgi:hypothetical protein